MTSARDFTEVEASICTAARMMEENKIYWVVGSGPPRFSLSLAKRLYAPKLVYMTEDGCMGQQTRYPLEAFMNMVCSRGNYRALGWASMNIACAHTAAGFVDYAVLATLQIDPYGNLNTSMMGDDYARPSRRFGGSGGANEMGSLAWGTIILTTIEKRKFVEKVDFVTTPGFLDGSPGARERAGLPAGTGPYRVVTPEAVFGYDEETHYMKLLGISKWVSIEEVLGNMGFEPIVPDNVEITDPPTEEELVVLRSEIDITGRTIGRGSKWISLP